MSNIIRGVKIFTRRLWNNGLIEFYFNFENGTPTKDRHKEHRVYSLWLWLWLWLWLSLLEKIDGIHPVTVRLPAYERLA
jgi:hypothetical protein